MKLLILLASLLSSARSIYVSPLTFNKYGYINDDVSMPQVVCNSLTCDGIGSPINCEYLFTRNINGLNDDVFGCHANNRYGWAIGLHKITCNNLVKESCQINITAMFHGIPIGNSLTEEQMVVGFIAFPLMILLLIVMCCANRPVRKRSFIRNSSEHQSYSYKRRTRMHYYLLLCFVIKMLNYLLKYT